MDLNHVVVKMNVQVLQIIMDKLHPQKHHGYQIIQIVDILVVILFCQIGILIDEIIGQIVQIIHEITMIYGDEVMMITLMR